ncbi:MAG: choice-of-anchor L domain-containing protein [Myxococcota bacterium]|nr:choice-of-anchor L domain-containing protein [Myxococcota bacterium]
MKPWRAYLRYLMAYLLTATVLGCGDSPASAPIVLDTDAGAEVDAAGETDGEDTFVPTDATDDEDTNATDGTEDANAPDSIDEPMDVSVDEDIADPVDIEDPEDIPTDAAADSVEPSEEIDAEPGEDALEPIKALCAPCTTDSDCTQDAGAFCAKIAKTASACVTPCAGTCPDGYECSTAFTLDGTESEACVPVEGQCACTDDYVGAESFCWSTNDNGSCQGSKVCTASGWGPCSASTPAAETCGGGDENCDGSIDEENAEGCSTIFADGDGDGFGNETDFKCLCAASGNYTSLVAGDCNDEIKEVNPNATEVCNTLDDNCDDITDPVGSVGCETWWYDQDLDGWGKSSESICACAPTGKYTSQQPGDCTDTDGLTNPDQPCGPSVCNIFIVSGGCPPGACDTPNISKPCPGALVCADSSSCRTTCASNVHCQPGFYCAAGACVAELAAGSPCTLDAECATQNCGNGFCCTGSNNCCNGNSTACDDQNPCTDQVCNSDFTCSYSFNNAPCGEQKCDGLNFIQPGTCDAGTCVQSSIECLSLDDPCQTPTCDNAAGCGVNTLAEGTVCAADACIGFELFEAKTCDAQGQCTVGGGTIPCPNALVCASDGSPQCATSCTGDEGCQPDSFCINANCEEKKLDGVSCGGDNECKSDSCIDSICCGGCCDYGTLGTNKYGQAAEICEDIVFEGKNSCARVISSFGNFTPGDIAPALNDSAFTQLSTGVAAQVSNQQYGENQNTDGPDPDGTATIANDLCGFTATFTAPADAQGFAFDFIFFSSEYPEYVGSEFNDTFNVMMTSDQYDNENIAFDNTGAPISINVAFFDICNGAGCTSPGSALLGTGYNGWIGGSTGWLTTTVPISGGEEFTLRFVIYDEGDHFFDSDVLINNFRWLEFVSGTGPVTE